MWQKTLQVSHVILQIFFGLLFYRNHLHNRLSMQTWEYVYLLMIRIVLNVMGMKTQDVLYMSILLPIITFIIIFINNVH